ncbi:MAG TPA: hypothetical protein VFH82_12955 [Gemmatimonadota bacterium]|jgi:hypothetical protein|nr:hypothetical protein [Gemmatimonadota bacterium]
MTDFDPAQIDTLLETLTGVVRARVRPDENGRQLREIHVLSDGALAPKQIVRNIETLLKTAFDLTIDHRIVSIAVLKQGAEREEQTAREAPSPEPQPERRMRKSPAGLASRVVFHKLQVVQDALKCTAHVELKLGDVIFEGTHRDTDTPEARVYAAARAVIEALEYLTEKQMAFYLAGLEQMRVYEDRLLVVLVEARRGRQRMRMVGTAAVKDDTHEAAVRAVLDAVNRFITRPVEPTAALAD